MVLFVHQIPTPPLCRAPGEFEHAKEEVKARQLRDAVVLECTCSPHSSAAVEKINVRFLRKIFLRNILKVAMCAELVSSCITDMFYRLALPCGHSTVCMHDNTGDVQCAEVCLFVWFTVHVLVVCSG